LDRLECHIEDLQRQRDVLQNIEKYTDRRLDFGDFIETDNLLGEEIARLQLELRAVGEVGPGEEVSEEEEEEEEVDSSFSFSKYRLEHVIEDKGALRPLKAEDLYVESNSHVRESFRVLYGMKKSYAKGGGE
jgi:hypothetical protein